MNPQITVCITTYNRNEQLQLCLNAVLNQTYRNFEIIIVDDCSKVKTRSLIENKYLNFDPRIRYFRHTKNKGLAASRNTAINNARGKYFTFCDDDDSWLPNYLKEFYLIAKNYNEDWCFACGNIYKNMMGVEVQTSFSYEGYLREHLKKGFTPPTASQFYYLKSLRRIKGYNESIKNGVDHDLWIKLAKYDLKIKYLSKALSIPNNNFNQKRMTTNYFNRIKGIKNSLKLWKNDLERMYGKQFYSIFYKEYLDREYSKFINDYLYSFNFNMVLKIKNNFSNLKFFLIIINFLAKLLIKIFIPKILFNKKKVVKIKPTLKI